MSELLKMLGCRYPIIQGPIGMFNSPKMIASVSEAGAYGMLALGFINKARWPTNCRSRCFHDSFVWLFSWLVAKLSPP